MEVDVYFQCLTEGCMPKKAHESDAGFDLYAAKAVVVPAGKTVVVPLGFCVELPKGFEMQIRPRSGLSLSSTLMSPNSPGTIDSGFRGEVGFIVHNYGSENYLVEKGQRVCQGVIAQLPDVNPVQVCTVSESDRGSAGFGSTGK